MTTAPDNRKNNRANIFFGKVAMIRLRQRERESTKTTLVEMFSQLQITVAERLKNQSNAQLEEEKDNRTNGQRPLPHVEGVFMFVWSSTSRAETVS